ncbi:MAG: gamma-glutamyl-gamma-aminobutyrate hydrolase family protein, partial [Nitrospiria bacterium]
VKGTLLHRMLSQDRIDVNSAHHQAVREVGRGVVVNALAPDGVIEGFEVPEYKFCLGIQWHPEFLVTPHDRKIFEAFIDHARA